MSKLERAVEKTIWVAVVGAVVRTVPSMSVMILKLLGGILDAY